MKHSGRRRLFKAGLVLGAALAFGAFAVLPEDARAQADWPKDPITFVVPFNAGGSADRLARGLADLLSPELGVPVTVVNKPGGAGALGATWFQQQPADGSHFLVMQATPYLANAILVNGAPVKWEDFHFINAQWDDYAILAVPAGSPYRSLEELIAAMREPGKVSSGIIHGNGGHLQTLIMLDKLGIPVSNIRFVTYDGGAPLRAALAGGQVDFEVLAAQAALPIQDKIRALAVVRDKPSKNWDAPLINEVLKAAHGFTMPIIGGNVTAVIAHAAFPQQHPERYQRFVDAYRKVIQSPEGQAWAAKGNLGADWVGPEESEKLLDANYEALKQYNDLIP